MTKAEIRIKNKILRKSLGMPGINTGTEKIHGLLFSRIMVHRFSPIHVFLPIEKHFEPNTFKILETLFADFAPDVFTSISLENSELLHVPIFSNTTFQNNKWGIPESLNKEAGLRSKAFFEKYKNEDILILVPLLGFDKTGHRVGYGKGYYDVFLEHKTEKTITIGISLLEVEDEEISDISATDCFLNYCITPTKVWTFAQK